MSHEEELKLISILIEFKPSLKSDQRLLKTSYSKINLHNSKSYDVQELLSINWDNNSYQQSVNVLYLMERSYIQFS